MKNQDFEGTAVLEKLAEIGKVESFLEAIDSDDFSKLTHLLKLAGLDSDSISKVLQKIAEGEEP